MLLQKLDHLSMIMMEIFVLMMRINGPTTPTAATAAVAGKQEWRSKCCVAVMWQWHLHIRSPSTQYKDDAEQGVKFAIGNKLLASIKYNATYLP